MKTRFAQQQWWIITPLFVGLLAAGIAGSAGTWDANAKPVPVLLVHGANDTADRAWANPNELGGLGC